MWNEAEKEAISKMASEMDMSEKAIIRQAIRLYQIVHLNGKNGLEMGFYNNEGKRVITSGPLSEMY